MKFLKYLTLTLVFGCAFPSMANTGIVFVHGTGNQNDAYNDYWTGGFVNSVKNGVNAQSLVINCNFDKFMWDDGAAGCLADQLQQFIQTQNISSLYLITHSNGGNIVRWVMSNPTYDSRYPAIISRIQNVTAIAPSSEGTPLADAAIDGNVFESTLGWLLGYKSDAVRQQQVSWMQYYNDTYLYGTQGRPSLPATFKSIVGSDVDSAIWDGDSYCGGYQYQVALEVTQNWLNSCSDGFLNCSSQSAAGNVWFYDKHKTKGKEPLSHHQSRRDCFNLDVILRNDI